MRNYSIRVWGVLAILLLVGCAVGDPYRDGMKKLPAIKAGEGRIVAYRTVNPLASFFPRVLWLDGKAIADVYGSSVTVYDTKSGPHTINYNDGESKLAIDVPAGKNIYLKYGIVDDQRNQGNTSVTIIADSAAESEIGDLHLIETKLRNPSEIKQ